MTGKLHALLIGIDQYTPSQRSEIDYYSPLAGAVGDIRRVRDFLLGLPAPPARIFELTASSGEGPEPIEPRDRWPTYETLVSKFRELTAGADPGDQVYVHYSGHGGRVPTIFDAEKGERGFDETLVPCNIADPAARHLHDIEFATLIQEMIDKGLFVTVVLDCCHSGGLTRANPQGYVLLAACRPCERAFEYPLADGESHGVLTYWLLDTLRHGGISGTWQEIYDVVFCRVHAQFPAQAPMLYGEKNRPFLGGPVDSEQNTPEDDRPAGVRILAVRGRWILLGAGEAEGLREGMRFAVYPPGLERQLAGKRLAEVEVRKVGATESWAEVLKILFRADIHEGGRAVPLGGLAVKRPVLCALVSGEPSPAADWYAMLCKVREAIGCDNSGALKIAEEGETADFQVSVNERGEYEIWYATGRPLVNLGPALPVAVPAAEAELLCRLIHLAKFGDLEQIANGDARSPLKGKLHLKPRRIEASAATGDVADQRPLGELESAGPIELRCGERLLLEIENKFARSLNVILLNLRSDWGIEQIFPSKRDAEFWPLDPGEKTTVCICGYLPDGIAKSREVIKAFATIGVPDFLWRELQPLSNSASSRCPSTEQVCQPRVMFTPRGVVPEEVIDSNPLAVEDLAGRNWTTAQIEVLVRR